MRKTTIRTTDLFAYQENEKVSQKVGRLDNWLCGDYVSHAKRTSDAVSRSQVWRSVHTYLDFYYTY